ncbi:MAG: mandelate racemase/muconate lactonizing protein, partial [Verrucomicrobiota bacterium]
MKRRPFLKTLGATGAPTYLFNQPAQAAIDESALRDHRVDRVEFLSLNYHWPRLVGKNASRGIHGQKKIDRIAKIYTDQGAMGWGIGSGNDKLKSAVLGKRVSELIHPATGRLPNIPGNFDFALYDLAGIILDKPVYQLLGANGSKDTPIYSGMIYFDELEPARNPAGIEKIIENCQWDI